MSAIQEYGLDSLARALLILVLSIKDKEQKKEMSKLQFQKTILYYEHLQQEKEIAFSNFKYGGVSYELQESIETLEECDLVAKVGNKYMLTENGEKAVKELAEKYGDEAIRKLTFAKYQLNDLPDKELLFFMYMLLPHTQEKSIEFEKLKTKKETLVRKLFLKGRINLTTAAKWLEVDEKEFLDSISVRGQQ